MDKQAWLPQRDTTKRIAAEIPASRPAHPGAAAGPRARVLTAEDDDELRAVMRAVLESSGFDVTACANAEEAEAAFAAQAKFDLLLTDLEMPGMSGAVLAATLSRLDPALPIMIVSGATVSPQQRGDFTQQGWTFVSKPVSVPNLIRNIGALLSLSRTARPGGRSLASQTGA